LHDFCDADKSKEKWFQTPVRKFIKLDYFPGDLADEVAPRLERYFAKLLFEGDLLKVAIRETLTVVKNMTPSIGWSLLRTWLNGWITSTRFGSPDAGCEFGCKVEEDDGSADRVSHYIDCEVLWQTVLELVFREYGVTWAEQRWNAPVLRPPDLAFECFRHREKLIVLAVAVGAFHFLNAQIRNGARTGITKRTAPFYAFSALDCERDVFRKPLLYANGRSTFRDVVVENTTQDVGFLTDSDSESDKLCHEFDHTCGLLEPPLLDELSSSEGQFCTGSEIDRLTPVLAESFRRVLRVTKWPGPLGRRLPSTRGIARAPFC
jgi:hypothetical protein